MNIKEKGIVLVVVALTMMSLYLTYSSMLTTAMIFPLWILWLLAVICLTYFTTAGKNLVLFTKESKIELQKVVWPTRQETVQTTMIVMAMVSVMGILLWAFDSLVTFGIAKLTHLG